MFKIFLNLIYKKFNTEIFLTIDPSNVITIIAISIKSLIMSSVLLLLPFAPS